MAEYRETVTITKLDEDQNLVYGWASVAIDSQGVPVTDREGDRITVRELEKAAHEFVKNYREANEQHTGPKIGELVVSLVTTPDVQKALGMPDGSAVGWFVGFELAPETFAKVKSGEYGAFSIEGTAKRIPA